MRLPYIAISALTILLVQYASAATPSKKEERTEAPPMIGDTPSKKMTERNNRLRPYANLPIVRTKTYFTEYDANEVSGDMKYKGKPFILGGNISEISKDAFGRIYIAFHGDKYGMKTVHATLFEEQICGTFEKASICTAEAKASTLKKKDPIWLDCFGNGMVVKTPMATDCVIRL